MRRQRLRRPSHLPLRRRNHRRRRLPHQRRRLILANPGNCRIGCRQRRPPPFCLLWPSWRSFPACAARCSAPAALRLRSQMRPSGGRRNGRGIARWRKKPPPIPARRKPPVLALSRTIPARRFARADRGSRCARRPVMSNARREPNFRQRQAMRCGGDHLRRRDLLCGIFADLRQWRTCWRARADIARAKQACLNAQQRRKSEADETREHQERAVGPAPLLDGEYAADAIAVSACGVQRQRPHVFVCSSKIWWVHEAPLAPGQPSRPLKWEGSISDDGSCKPRWAAVRAMSRRADCRRGSQSRNALSRLRVAGDAVDPASALGGLFGGPLSAKLFQTRL